MSMDSHTQTCLENLHAQDGNVRFEAFESIITATDSPVDWAYEVWDEMVQNLPILRRKIGKADGPSAD